MGRQDVFVLGAGFSKAIDNRMPTMKELTDEVRARIADEGEFRLPSPLDADANDNIELWMTYLSQNQPWLRRSANQYNRALATRIEEYIADIIRERERTALGTAMSEWLGQLTRNWDTAQATVITLNYDTLVERASVGEPSDGNALSLSHIYPDNLANIRSIGKALLSASPRDTFAYYKLHGSINWHYSGREDFYGETIYFSNVSRWGLELTAHESDSEAPAKDKEALIIPPVAEKTTFFQNEYVRGIWQNAGVALSEATRVFVIGYSLPATDMGMEFFLQRYMPAAGTPWYIVDIDTEVTTRYRALLTNQNVQDGYVAESNAVQGFTADYPEVTP